jgi:glycosyltransferase involved in cell wall biosynthesis/CMP-N-acetylneuraminic acid synthetase
MPITASVIITAHNYGHYLPKCIDSTLDQTYDDYEVVIVDDGSTDNTQEILSEYEFDYPDTIRTIRLDGKGVSAASNVGIEAAEGKYVMRLDADDYIDENLLSVQAIYLDQNPEVDLVYPDYFTTDESGEVKEYVRLPAVEEEVKLLNRLPIGTGSLFKKSVWQELGGYDEEFYYQEDYDFWIRLTNKYNVHNVNLPLLYYRQHDSSKSDNISGRLEARRDVKSKFVENNLHSKANESEVLCVIPARTEERIEYPADHQNQNPLALLELAGRPLLDYTVCEALAADRIDRTILSTESKQIAKRGKELGAEVPFMRPPELSQPSAMLSEVVLHLLKKLRREESYSPDIIILPQYISPMKNAAYLDEAVETFIMFNVDSVISVKINNKFLWHPGKYGLDPLFEERLLREDREEIYQENGAISVLTPELLRDKGKLVGNRVGHTVMGEIPSIHIDQWFDFWQCNQILRDDEFQFNPDYRSSEL